jgi:hypothetical protein
MNANLKIQAALLSFLLFLVGLPTALNAEPAAPGPLLRQAYITLSYGKHDYNGHRYYAMREIEAAANELKFDLRGDGPGVERQHVSDDQLHEARAVLEQARRQVKGRVRKHVKKAIGEIDSALKTR